MGRDHVAQNVLQRTIRQIGHPPILRDSVSAIPGVPVNQPSEAFNGASPAVRAGMDAVALLEREAALLVAYMTSYGRYKGAAAAHDSVAAAGQAEAMVPLIDSAIASGSEAASREVEAQRLLLAVLDSAGRTGGNARPRAPSSTGVISPQLRDELIAGGMTRGEVDHLERELRASPGVAAQQLAAVRGQLAVDSSMRRGLGSTDARAWPPPSERPRLADAAATARQIRSAPMYLLGETTRKPSVAAERGSGGWFTRYGGLWWALPVIGIVLLAGYARWLRRRAA